MYSGSETDELEDPDLTQLERPSRAKKRPRKLDDAYVNTEQLLSQLDPTRKS